MCLSRRGALDSGHTGDVAVEQTKADSSSSSSRLHNQRRSDRTLPDLCHYVCCVSVCIHSHDVCFKVNSPNPQPSDSPLFSFHLSADVLPLIFLHIYFKRFASQTAALTTKQTWCKNSPSFLHLWFHFTFGQPLLPDGALHHWQSLPFLVYSTYIKTHHLVLHSGFIVEKKQQAVHILLRETLNLSISYCLLVALMWNNLICRQCRFPFWFAFILWLPQ